MKFTAVSYLSLLAAALSLLTPGSHAFAPGMTREVTRSLAVSSSTDNDGKPAIDFSALTEAANRALEEIPNYDASKVQKNLQEGELGKRGEVYFVAQSALIISIVLGGIPLVGDPLRVVLGPLFLVAGLAITVLSFVDLGSDSLSPFPQPTQEGALKTTGIYSQMRHPMYSSLLSVMLGLALITDSVDRLLLTVLLGYLMEVKSDKEEALLMERFGNAYAEYKAQVPEKFLPVTLVNILPWTD